MKNIQISITCAKTILLLKFTLGGKQNTNTKISLVFSNKITFMKLFVAGLPYDLDDAELMEIFEKFGTVVTARVAMDRDTGKSKGFGFVDMQNAEEGRDAIENLKDISLGKKPLIVKEAEEKAGPPSGGGGFRPGGQNRGGFNNNNNRRGY